MGPAQDDAGPVSRVLCQGMRLGSKGSPEMSERWPPRSLCDDCARGPAAEGDSMSALTCGERRPSTTSPCVAQAGLECPGSDVARIGRPKAQGTRQHFPEFRGCAPLSLSRSAAPLQHLAQQRPATPPEPKARMYLWETGFPIELESKLCAPAAFVVSSPAAELQIGTVKLRLSLRLMCVCDPFFDPARPLRGLLVRLEAQVDKSQRS